MLKNKLLLLLHLIFVLNLTNGQIVNIERFRIKSDTTGWFGELNVSCSFIQSTSNVFQTESNAQVELKRRKDLFLFVGNYSLLKGDGNKFIDEGMGHIRYNIKMNKGWRWDAFTQYQNNGILNIQDRFLFGTGPRVKILDQKNLRIYLASLFMYEYEKESSAMALIHHDLRNSSYLSFNIKPSSDIEIISTSYFQPLFYVYYDYRVLHQTSIKFNITKHLGFMVQYNHLYDRKPAEGAIRHSSKLLTGISYKFK